jgi:hypothetical protein
MLSAVTVERVFLLVGFLHRRQLSVKNIIVNHRKFTIWKKVLKKFLAVISVAKYNTGTFSIVNEICFNINYKPSSSQPRWIIAASRILSSLLFESAPKLLSTNSSLYDS